MAEILVVDDDSSICDMLCFLLGSEGYRVRKAYDAREALNCVGESVPDIVLVDWMMPGMNGVELIRCLRSEPTTRRLPIIMLTAKDSESDKVEGFGGGADDYILKPFSNRELCVRVKALLRRSKPHKTQEKFICKDMVLDPQMHTVGIDGEDIVIPAAEFRLLHFLVSHEGLVFSRLQLLDSVWGTEKFVEERTVDVQIGRLRKTLVRNARHSIVKNIQTVRGIGYCYRSNRV